jgi:hypothetical protein
VAHVVVVEHQRDEVQASLGHGGRDRVLERLDDGHHRRRGHAGGAQPGVALDDGGAGSRAGIGAARRRAAGTATPGRLSPSGCAGGAAARAGSRGGALAVDDPAGSDRACEQFRRVAAARADVERRDAGADAG